jgi:hypothetical protein
MLKNINVRNTNFAENVHVPSVYISSKNISTAEGLAFN